MMAVQHQICSPRASQSFCRVSTTTPLPSSHPARHSSIRRVQTSALSDVAVLAQMMSGMPSTTPATQNSVQNTLQNAPLSLQESPEKLIIVAALLAVAVGGYLLQKR